MTLRIQQSIFAQNVAKLINEIFKSGYYCTLGESYRPPETAALYETQGRGIKDSNHCKRLAIDINLFDHNGNYLIDGGSYKRFGDWWTTLHIDNRWGGDFERRDYVHFELNMK